MVVDAREMMEEEPKPRPIFEVIKPIVEVPMEKAPKPDKYKISMMFADDSANETEAYSWRGVINFLRDLPDTIPVETVVIMRGDD